ncbi:MAG: HAD-IC family P-type ATPase [Thermodesulforhabdaceae bacterium]
MEWYRMSVSEVLNRLGSSEKGLTSEEAQKRLAVYGLNKLKEEEKINFFLLFLKQFTNPLVIILLVASVVTTAIKEYVDTGVILSVVVINAIIGFIEEVKAERSVRALKKMLVSKAIVVRNGVEEEIPSEYIVPGDIIKIGSGDRIPADVRIIKALELKIDESMLTGESLPAEKKDITIETPDLLPADQRNMAFMGTVVVSGRSEGVVVSTGENTILGKIARSVQEIGPVKAPIQKKFENFARLLGIIILAACGVLFAAGLMMGGSFREMFMVSVAGAVASIPEGLPIAVSVAMAVGVARMAKKNAIIRVPAAVETLGSTTVICSDKTGTLTKNEMTVVKLYVESRILDVPDSESNEEGSVTTSRNIEKKDGAKVVDLLRIGLLCNESEVIKKDGQLVIKGDPTEGALIIAASKFGLTKKDELSRFPLVSMIPFESDRGFMATLHEDGNQRILFVKGAPEKVIEMSLASPEERKAFLETSAKFAQEGLRVLCFAQRFLPSYKENITGEDLKDLELVGLQGMIDPPRPEVPEAIKGCQRAGIRVVMITGDHVDTASAIAKKLGISRENQEVISGQALEKMTDDELYEKIPKVSVFARVAPHHKLRIARQFIRRGEIVAMTGDGVNDAPALKAAHIGIAMGKAGTDVAKESADMILTDDNFATIFNAVKEGRIVFDNLRKMVFFLIPTGIAAVISILVTLFLGIPIPYTPSQLLWINLVTNSLQDVSLAFEPGEPGIIDRPPRHPKEPIMSRVLLERTIIVSLVISLGGVYLYWKSLQAGHELEYARTVAVTTMVFFQFFQTWNARSERLSVFTIPFFSNKFLFLSMMLAILAQLGFIYIPAFEWLFRTRPLEYKDLILSIGMASTIIVVVEADKLIRRVLCRDNFATKECRY